MSPEQQAEVLEMLDNVTASLDSCVVGYGQQMSSADRHHRSQLVTQAQDLLRRATNGAINRE